jgi:hypothetical protein
MEAIIDELVARARKAQAAFERNGSQETSTTPQPLPRPGH